MKKLVRDRILEIIKGAGKKPITRIADDDEFKLELVKKLKEETDEFFESEDRRSL